MKVEPLHIIQNSRRRAFLRVLRDLGGEASLREVVRRVAKDEGEWVTRRLVKNIHIKASWEGDSSYKGASSGSTTLMVME